MWQRWMNNINVETLSVFQDGRTGTDVREVEFRLPSNPEAFWGFLGEQFEPCRYHPGTLFAENFLENSDPASLEIGNIREITEGLDGLRVGYAFRLKQKKA